MTSDLHRGRRLLDDAENLLALPGRLTIVRAENMPKTDEPETPPAPLSHERLMHRLTCAAVRRHLL